MKKVLALLIAAILVQACSKRGDSTDDLLNANVESMDEMVVPNGFDYSMVKIQTIPIELITTSTGKAIINAYALKPGSKRIAHGSYILKPNTPSQFEVQVPKHYDGIMLEVQLETGEVLKSNYSFGAPTVIFESKEDRQSFQSVSTFKMTTPDCSSGCNVTKAGTLNADLVVKADSVVCFTGDFNGYDVEIQGNGELRICGTHTNVQDIVFTGTGGSVHVSDGSSVTFASGKGIAAGTDSEVYVYANATVNLNGAWLANGEDWFNYGTVNISHTWWSDVQNSIFTNYSGGTLTSNFGILITGGPSYVLSASNAQLINHGSVEPTALQARWGGVINNHCKIHVTHHFASLQNGVVINNGALYSDNDIYFGYVTPHDGPTTWTLGANSIVLGDALYFDEATVSGPVSGRAVLKSLVSASETTAGGNSISGNVDLCPEGTNSVPSSVFSGGAEVSCANGIATSACITTGHSADSDRDGLADAIDDYPNDSLRATDASSLQSTLIAEDKWPIAGDYDFNDMVMLYKWDYVLDAWSQAKDISFSYRLKARGAGHDNAFGFTLDTDEGNIASVTGGTYTNGFITNNANGTEQTSSSATTSCFIVSDKLHDQLEMWNTFGDTAVEITGWTNYTIVFTDAVNPSVMNTFNPFMIAQRIRGKEIHRVDELPTALVNTEYFGQAADNTTDWTTAPSTYKTDANLPWMMNVPTDFNYPREHRDLTTAYLNFANWAQSGGTQNMDWYDYSIPANIDASRIIISQ